MALNNLQWHFSYDNVLLWTPSHGRAKAGRPVEPTYNSSVPIPDVALKTYRKRWTIEKGDGRGSGISVLMAQHDDDNDDDHKYRSYK